MQNNKKVINIILRDENLKIIERKINDYKPEPEIVGYKIKNKYGTIWLSKNQFNVLFREWENLF